MINMNKDEIQTICQEYLSGMTPQKIADKHYCSRPTIRNYLIRCGVQLREKYQKPKPRVVKIGHERKVNNKPRYPIAMILHDWQSDMSIEKIANIYGFKSRENASRFVKRMRKNGYKFDYRKKYAKRDTLGRFTKE